MRQEQNRGVSDPIRVGVSSCLLGKKVRHDAGHKHDRYLTDLLGQFVTFVPVCPEYEVGMGIPREPIRLTGDPDRPRLVGNKTGEDWTERMDDYSHSLMRRRRVTDLSGFVLKNRSPSCGMERVKVYIKPDTVQRKGTGLFARTLMEVFPDLPVEEEGRLNDPELRENFVERVFAYRRLTELFAGRFSRGRIVEFHAAHKFMLMAHSTDYYRRLGRLVGSVKDMTPDGFRAEYRSLFMRALRFKATVRKNTNVLQHLAGFLKKQLDEKEKSDLHLAIADYHAGLIPLIVPITLLRHFVGKYEIDYIKNQYYLNPHPKELMLRNHV